MRTQKQIEYNRRYQRERKQRLREHGICTECGREKAATGICRCKGCQEVLKIKKRAKEAERKAASLCVQCGKEAIAGQTQCAACALKRRMREAERRKKKASAA